MNEDGCIDEAALDRLQRLSRGGTLVREMIDIYLDYAPKLLAAALAGEQGDDLEAIERAAHSLKSSAANLGAFGVRDLAARIELLAREKNMSSVRPLLRELVPAFESVKARLEELRKELFP
jgi:HPt (histidine-containing phosphotransfer) domain-containing protein